MRSASITRAPSSARMAATVLFPEPMPPVSPITGAAIAGPAIPIAPPSRATRSPPPRRLGITPAGGRAHVAAGGRGGGEGPSLVRRLHLPARRLSPDRQAAGRCAHAFRPDRLVDREQRPAERDDRPRQLRA